jgi:hypothetical protein
MRYGYRLIVYRRRPAHAGRRGTLETSPGDNGEIGEVMARTDSHRPYRTVMDPDILETRGWQREWSKHFGQPEARRIEMRKAIRRVRRAKGYRTDWDGYVHPNDKPGWWD